MRGMTTSLWDDPDNMYAVISMAIKVAKSVDPDDLEIASTMGAVQEIFVLRQSSTGAAILKCGDERILSAFIGFLFIVRQDLEQQGEDITAYTYGITSPLPETNAPGSSEVN